MASFWLYLGVAFGGLIGGAVIAAVLFLIFSRIKDYFKIKRKLPQTKAEVSKYVKENKDYFLDGEKQETTDKEVIEDARQQTNRIRELEKLRRNARLKETARRKEQHPTSSTGTGNVEVNKELPADPDPVNDTDPRESLSAKRRIRFD